MFKWSYEFSTEYDFPIHKVWECSTNPDNYSKFLHQCESIQYDKEKSVIKAHFKGRKYIRVTILLTEFEMHRKIGTRIKGTLGLTDTVTEYHEITSNKTKIVTKINLVSILTPFLKSYFKKKTDKESAKQKEILTSLLQADARYDEKAPTSRTLETFV